MHDEFLLFDLPPAGLDKSLKMRWGVKLYRIRYPAQKLVDSYHEIIIQIQTIVDGDDHAPAILHHPSKLPQRNDEIIFAVKMIEGWRRKNAVKHPWRKRQITHVPTSIWTLRLHFPLYFEDFVNVGDYDDIPMWVPEYHKV